MVDAFSGVKNIHGGIEGGDESDLVEALGGVELSMMVEGRCERL